MWVRTRIDPDAVSDVNPDRLINLAHYRGVAVAARLEPPVFSSGREAVDRTTPSERAAPRHWDVVAYPSPVNGIPNGPEVLAVLPTELEARAVLGRLTDAMVRGAGGLDLNDFAWPAPPELAVAADVAAPAE